MKHKVRIFSNTNINNLFKQLFPSFELEFYTLDNLQIKNIFPGDIILIDENYDIRKLISNILTHDDYLILTNSQSENYVVNKNISILKMPISVSKIKNYIIKFVTNRRTHFKGIEIINKKLINNNNKTSCFLTDIENEILLYLINNKDCKKDFIKKNILNIKSEIETNSLDSHLTRIRKKLQKIKVPLKIQSKNDVLTIFSNQKN